MYMLFLMIHYLRDLTPLRGGEIYANELHFIVLQTSSVDQSKGTRTGADVWSFQMNKIMTIS